MLKTVAQLTLRTKQVIKKNDNGEITAPLDQSLRLDFIDSFINWMTGGLWASSEVGYKDDFIPTSPSAFARVDMIKGASKDNPLTELYLQSPDLTIWKITIDNSGIIQQETV